LSNPLQNRSAAKQQGFTLIEMIGVLAIIAILGGISAPKVFDAINDARYRQAEGNMHAMQIAMVSFAKDTGVWPGRNEGVYYLYGTGKKAAAASSNAMCGGGGKSANLADYLISNTNNYRGWHGPYMDGMPEDPWHFRYAVNAGGLFGMSGGNVWIVSPGPDGKCDTIRTADVVSGDDVALLIHRTAGGTSTIAAGGNGGVSAGGNGGAPTGGNKAVNLASIKGAAILGLTPAQIAKLTPVQIAMMSAANFAKLTAAQQAALTTAQLAERKVSSAVRAMNQTQFPKLTPTQVKYLSTAQLAGANNAWWFSQIPAAVKSELNQSQILAISPSVIGPNAGKLSATQIAWLAPDQLSAVKGGDALVNMLKKSPSMIGKISPTQVGSVTNGWWMGQLVKTVGANLSKGQVQAIPLSGAGVASSLSVQQISWMSSTQIGAIKGSDVLVKLMQKVPTMINQISPSQISSITNGWWFGNMPSASLQSMTKAQVNAVPATIYPNIKAKLTANQQVWRP